MLCVVVDQIMFGELSTSQLFEVGFNDELITSCSSVFPFACENSDRQLAVSVVEVSPHIKGTS
jgi:hypothetical protein